MYFARLSASTAGLSPSSEVEALPVERRSGAGAKKSSLQPSPFSQAPRPG
jgi:hypothetical protein